MNITLLACGKWAITQNGALAICILFYTYEEAEQFLFVLNTL